MNIELILLAFKIATVSSVQVTSILDQSHLRRHGKATQIIQEFSNHGSVGIQSTTKIKKLNRSSEISGNSVTDRKEYGVVVLRVVSSKST